MAKNRLYPTIALILCVAVVTSLAGCEQLEHTPDPEISFDGDMNTSASGFEMDGIVTKGPGDERTYRNVTVTLYEQNGSVIRMASLGSLDDPVPVTMESRQVPAYVVIDSPSFWERDSLAVSYYVYVGENGDPYKHQWAGARDDLPVGT